jgi:hypothetical protein
MIYPMSGWLLRADEIPPPLQTYAEAATPM